jgi:hypothetical protein
VRDPILIVPVAVAIVLIVSGRVYRRRPWGNRVAIVGYVLLAITAVLALATRG